MSVSKKAYGYALLTVGFWSTVASAFKISLRYLDYLDLLLLASIVSTVTLFIIMSMRGQMRLLWSFSKGDFFNSALLGFLNPFLYYCVLFKAYSLLPAQQAQPLNYTWPVMLALLSVPLLGQRLSLKSLLAITISFIGIVVVSTRGSLEGFGETSLPGVFLATGSSVIWALFWIFNVRDPRDESAKLFLNFVFGSCFIALLFIFLGKPFPVNHRGLIGAAYVGLFEMGITFFVWLKALTLSGSAVRVANLVYLSPFISLIVIRYAVGEKILFSTIVGLSLIVGGIIIQQNRGRRHEYQDS